MNRPEFVNLLENFSVTVTSTPSATAAQTITMVSSFLDTVQTTKLGAEYVTVITDQLPSLEDNTSNNGEQNL